MEMKKMLRTGIVITLVALSAVSCVTNRKVAYLQDMKHATQIELENRFEAVISPYDELDVVDCVHVGSVEGFQDRSFIQQIQFNFITIIN